MKGLVKAQKGNLLTVQIVRQEACGHCKACLSGYMQADMDLDAKNLCDAEVGDWVELELQDNAFVKAVTISYGIPLIGLMLGVFLGYYGIGFFAPAYAELISFACAIVGTLLGYGWIKSKNDRWNSGKYTPLAVRLTTQE